MEQLNEYLIGWSGYFRIAQAHSIFIRLDKWIRARLQMCMLKQWKQCKTKMHKLRSLGLSKEWARSIASSSKGPWRLVHTHQIHAALG
ncbi:group II intron maturase-specific domain-containing protein, partial [Pseudomonas silesiensis]|uniref:group II intron maturase-specific domain-containing protein n=1 Tax=Pseudomonas silesiensis TaxID=1853130 RepID=UPI0034D5DFFD